MCRYIDLSGLLIRNGAFLEKARFFCGFSRKIGLFLRVFAVRAAGFDSKFLSFLLMEEVGKGCFLNGNVRFLVKMNVFLRSFHLI